MALELGHWSGMIVLVEWPVVQVVETTNHINQIQSDSIDNCDGYDNDKKNFTS